MNQFEAEILCQNIGAARRSVHIRQEADGTYVLLVAGGNVMLRTSGAAIRWCGANLEM